MHLKDVEIFCEVAALRSFSKAADAFDISQSSASHAVMALERRLGVSLVDRSKRPLALTAAGAAYHEGCRELLRGFQELEARVTGLEAAVRGTLTIAAIYSVGLLQIDALVRRFEDAHPAVQVRIDYCHPADVYKALRSDAVELGLLSFPREGGEFCSQPWQDQEMVLVVPPGHRLAGAECVSPRELDGEPFVTFQTGLAVRKRIDRWLRTAGVQVAVIHAFDNVENVKRDVEIGTGVALLPRPTVSREVELGSLKAVALAGVRWTRPLGIVRRRHRNPSPAARRFIDLLRTVADQEAAAGKPVAAAT